MKQASQLGILISMDLNDNELKCITTNEIGLVGVVFRFICGEACCGNTQTPPLNAG